MFTILLCCQYTAFKFHIFAQNLSEFDERIRKKNSRSLSFPSQLCANRNNNNRFLFYPFDPRVRCAYVLYLFIDFLFEFEMYGIYIYMRFRKEKKNHMPVVYEISILNRGFQVKIFCSV